ncbi:MAG: cytochrome c biogenesis protein CcdA [bacterium]
MNILIAFSGGLLAFFSPCFLPLVPAYLIYITGLSFDELKNVRLRTILHSLAFIFGFTVIFTLLGLSASLLGQFLFDFKDIFRVVGGLFVVLLGLYLTGWLKLPLLGYDKKFQLKVKPAGYFGSFVVGIVFAIGWTPCIGPILAGILVYASQSESLGEGALLLVAFSLGLGLPLFLFSLAVNYSLSLLKVINKYVGIIQKVCGVGLVIVGVLLLVGRF